MVSHLRDEQLLLRYCDLQLCFWWIKRNTICLFIWTNRYLRWWLLQFNRNKEQLCDENIIISSSELVLSIYIYDTQNVFFTTFIRWTEKCFTYKLICTPTSKKYCFQIILFTFYILIRTIIDRGLFVQLWYSILVYFFKLTTVQTLRNAE